MTILTMAGDAFTIKEHDRERLLFKKTEQHRSELARHRKRNVIITVKIMKKYKRGRE